MHETTMKALVCEKHGPPEQLIYRDVTSPEPGAGEILIENRAAGLNFPDALIIQNLYQTKPVLPFSPGAELAGIVSKAGPEVTDFVVGDRVAAFTTIGAFADRVAVSASHANLVPESMDLATAGAFTLAYGTSYHALVQRAQLKAGETLLVLGAAGGVGLAAVEIGKALGARVIAGASNHEKLAHARDRGADDLIDYGDRDIREAVKRLTGGKGADVIFDPVGDRLAEPAFRSVAWGGRYLVIGFAGGCIPALPLNLPLIKGAAIIGVYWGEFVDRHPDIHKDNQAELYRLHAEGKLRPLISARFPLSRGSEAIRWMMDRKALGKVLVIPGE